MITRFYIIGEEIRTAAYSPCESYRYSLDIIWNASLKSMAVIGLNPSTATELVDDPTLRRVKRFARDWGYGGVRMLNAFALRSPDPKVLYTHKDPIGSENTIEFLKLMALDPTIAAWGSAIQLNNKWNHYYRGHEISKALPDLQCLGITVKGAHPKHPLYLPANLTTIPFSYKE